MMLNAFSLFKCLYVYFHMNTCMLNVTTQSIAFYIALCMFKNNSVISFVCGGNLLFADLSSKTFICASLKNTHEQESHHS